MNRIVLLPQVMHNPAISLKNLWRTFLFENKAVINLYVEDPTERQTLQYCEKGDINHALIKRQCQSSKVNFHYNAYFSMNNFNEKLSTSILFNLCERLNPFCVGTRLVN